MADRAFKYSKTEREHVQRMTARHWMNMVRLLVHASGKGRIRVPRAALASMPVATVTVYHDRLSEDVMVCVGEVELGPQWIPVPPPDAKEVVA